MGQACLACCTQFDCRITCIWTHMLTPLYLFSSLLSCLKRDKKHFPALNAQRNKHIPCIISLHSSFFLSLGLLLFPFPLHHKPLVISPWTGCNFHLSLHSSLRFSVLYSIRPPFLLKDIWFWNTKGPFFIILSFALFW